MEFFIVLILAFVVSGIVMPWLNRAKIDGLMKEVHALQRELWEKMAYIDSLQASDLKPKEKLEAKPLAQDKPAPQIHTNKEIPKPSELDEEHTDYKNIIVERPPIAMKSMAASGKTLNTSKTNNPPKPKVNIEPPSSDPFFQNFASQLPVWIGAIALVLAGFFLVKYSIDNNLLGPKVRIIMGGIMGLAFLISGHFISKAPKFANGEKISQALLGVGIATCYIDLFAAHRLYDLIPNSFAFMAMAAVTLLAVFLSLRHGLPIALLGLIGGFLTPALIDSDNASAPALFAYLFFVFSGLMHVIKRKNWWGLAIPTSFIAFLWTLYWSLNYFNSSDAAWVSVFIVAVCISVIAYSQSAYQQMLKDKPENWQLLPVLHYMTFGFASFLMAVITVQSNYGWFEFGVFAMISAASLILARLKQDLYGIGPWISLGLSAITLLFWQDLSLSTHGLMLLTFALLFSISSLIFIFQQRKTMLWGFLHTVSNVVFFLIAYVNLYENSLNTIWQGFWGMLSALIAVSHAIVFMRMQNKDFVHDFKAELETLYAVAFSTFLSMAFLIELKQEFAAIAIACQMATTAFFYLKHHLKHLRSIVVALSLVFIGLMLPQILLLLQLSMYAIFNEALNSWDSIPMVEWPLLQLGLPAALFLITSHCLQKKKPGNDTEFLDYVSIGLLTLMSYYVVRHLFYGSAQDILVQKASFIERGVIHSVIALGSMLCFYIGRNFKRVSFSNAALLLASVVCFRIVYFDMILHNPLWTDELIPGVLIFNALALPFALPILWSYCIGKELKALNLAGWQKFAEVFMFILTFVWISLNVRFAFHGNVLGAGSSSGAEIYTYSAVWLLFAIGLLVMSTLKKSRALYKASYAMLSLVVAKVFLYDAAALTGLYRVISLFGLGLSLIGISWFYNRFSIKKTDI